MPRDDAGHCLGGLRNRINGQDHRRRRVQQANGQPLKTGSFGRDDLLPGKVPTWVETDRISSSGSQPIGIPRPGTPLAAPAHGWWNTILERVGSSGVFVAIQWWKPDRGIGSIVEFIGFHRLGHVLVDDSPHAPGNIRIGRLSRSILSRIRFILESSKRYRPLQRWFPHSSWCRRPSLARKGIRTAGKPDDLKHFLGAA